MDILGVGIDLVEIPRIRTARFRDRIAEYLFHASEIEDMKRSRDEVQFIASRLAAKEAVIKAFPGKLGYKDVRITKEGTKPAVRFENAHNQANYQVFLSISHTVDHAVGCATVCAIAQA